MKQSIFILKKTADGSDTLYSSEMDESYHSVNGAAQESRHVFIEAGLQQIKKQKFSVFEVGFGTGLNALLTWGEAHKNNLQIYYDAIEAFPISNTVIQSLNYKDLEPELPSDAFLQLHGAPWEKPAILEENRFIISKIQADFTNYTFSRKYDLVYFDAFAPDKQAEMWEEELFLKIFNTLHDQGILVTYCAKGEVRRQMQRS
ncbi:MAG: tRNA (5-methylaminomethyl-2-thiouridine)(34)-methyltransferase MnmD, partial [Bacteroidales bacterium]|nr:tRNA (5-methylaminomethyl-2-thiouridine)(34)-methyltransferase MnmD [Bacteroidales bacterium]